MPTASDLDYTAATRNLIDWHLRDGVRRLHISDKPIPKVLTRTQTCEMKPIGLWYGFNDSWMDWCLSEVEGGWLQPLIYELTLDESKILRISDIEQFEAFENKYWGYPAAYTQSSDVRRKYRSIDDPIHEDFLLPPDFRRLMSHINWEKVAGQYHGIEITPYMGTKRLHSLWYYGWDCESGVVWDGAAVKELRLFAEYDEETKEFRRIE